MVWAVSLSTMTLIRHRLTPGLSSYAIRGLVEFGKLTCPLAHPVPYLRNSTPEAVPQYISGRTSYLRVRLAFHPYPQLIL
jgi:hypothetical protein